jgi:3-deoxy-D-manno-octulosonate 8-phosphate phosphatase (KDO 8-P phosphatase)
MMAKKKLTKKAALKRAAKIKLLLTDVDGVLTDTGVFYSAKGEEMKRFSIRDGMGIERLRSIAGVETGIITREDNQIVASRAKRLHIEELHMGVMDKTNTFEDILNRTKIKANEVAYMGDDTNDLGIMEKVGLSACPGDATKFAKDAADFIVESKGGYGALRDLCELIIEAKTNPAEKKKKRKK